MTDPRPGRLVFSTDSLPEPERLKLWSDGFVHRRMAMTFVDRSEGNLKFEVEFIPLGGVAAGIIRGTPSSFIRQPGDGNDGLFLISIRSGAFAVVQSEVRTELDIGAAAIFDNRLAGELHCLYAGETWSVSVPREALRHLVPNLDGAVERTILADNSVLRLLIGYLETLFGLDEIAESDLAGVHIADLVASLISPPRKGAGLIETESARAANLKAVMEGISELSSDPDLDPAGVARHVGISVRYLHRLLEDTGKSLLEHVLERRLERAHRLLRDPRLGGAKISDIAIQAGFADLSHFNRSFRRRFGVTPTEARAEAAKKENPDPQSPANGTRGNEQ